MVTWPCWPPVFSGRRLRCVVAPKRSFPVQVAAGILRSSWRESCDVEESLWSGAPRSRPWPRRSKEQRWDFILATPTSHEALRNLLTRMRPIVPPPPWRRPPTPEAGCWCSRSCCSWPRDSGSLAADSSRGLFKPRTGEPRAGSRDRLGHGELRELLGARRGALEAKRPKPNATSAGSRASCCRGREWSPW